jgi:hypothetical protein
MNVTQLLSAGGVAEYAVLWSTHSLARETKCGGTCC